MKKWWVIALAVMLMAFTISGCIKFTGLESAEESKTEEPSDPGKESDTETEEPSEETDDSTDESEPETGDEGPVANSEQIGHLRAVFTQETVYLDAVGYKLGEAGFCEKIEGQGWVLYQSDKDAEIEARDYDKVAYERTSDDLVIFYVDNPSSSARPASECVLYAVLVDNYDPENVVNAYVPGYIGIGYTIEEVTDYFGTPGEVSYEEDGETVDCYDYYSYDYSSLDDPDGYYCLSFEFEYGVVMTVYLARYFDEELDEDEPAETVYDFEDFNLRIRVPEDYPVSSEEDLKAAGNEYWTHLFMSVNGVDTLDVEYMEESTYTVIKAANYDEEDLVNLLATTMEQTLSASTSSLEGTWGDPETVEIAGQDFTGVRWDGAVNGVNSSMFIYCRDTGKNFLAIISFHALQSGGVDEHLDFFEPLD